MGSPSAGIAIVRSSPAAIRRRSAIMACPDRGSSAPARLFQQGVVEAVAGCIGKYLAFDKGNCRREGRWLALPGLLPRAWRHDRENLGVQVALEKRQQLPAILLREKR